MRRAVSREFWGVMLGDSGPLFGGWHPALQRPRYDGEPTRAVLFRTRRQARDFAATERMRWRLRHDSLSQWRLRVVKVTERVTVQR